jgi:Ca2+-binding EF-hand superfamily protein
MKMIMNKLRFYISQQNLDLRKVMDSMGFGSGREEIVYHDFYQFFRRVYPQITHEDADYVFRRTDADHSGTISVEELKDILLESGMKLASQFELVPSFERRGDGRETFTRISAETSGKIKNCF